MVFKAHSDINKRSKGLLDRILNIVSKTHFSIIKERLKGLIDRIFNMVSKAHFDNMQSQLNLNIGTPPRSMKRLFSMWLLYSEKRLNRLVVVFAMASVEEHNFFIRNCIVKYTIINFPSRASAPTDNYIERARTLSYYYQDPSCLSRWRMNKYRIGKYSYIV